MTNDLKRLLTDEELHNLKKLSIDLKTYQNTILKPLKDSLAGEARRAINHTRKIELALREGEKIQSQINDVLGETT
jgi:hypothetical protein